MRCKFVDTEPATTREQIKKIEYALGSSLPDEYKNFLLQHNGGRPIPNFFRYLHNGEEIESDIAWFYSVSSSEYENLLKENTYFRSHNSIPKNSIIIGRNSGSDQIYLSTETSEYGAVYIWHHDSEITDNTCFIASSFKEFLNIIM